MSIEYTPKFHPTPWTDGIDRVSAGGDNGFNLRFATIEAEFERLSEIVGEVSDTLDALSQPPARPVKLTLTPALVTTTTAWTHVHGGAVKGTGETAAGGMQAVALPHGSLIQALRVIGQKDSGNLTVALRRQGLAAVAAAEIVVGMMAPAGPFDVSVAAPSSEIAKVDDEQFRYYLTADLNSALLGSVSQVSLAAFQITYVLR
ncbi:hypothetical protein HII36_08760 [Nonomuraea sp. NN258]|uniref:hypothetical protein n=1 Tax=Nonomuraea antri TaxID=2730852 RepID=UPI00156A3861|nr:hypothetical protein [Nonomuraea antri]NRQ31929.1 hypothetical protein [Nonomuraea antri]